MGAVGVWGSGGVGMMRVWEQRGQGTRGCGVGVVVPPHPFPWPTAFLGVEMQPQ